MWEFGTHETYELNDILQLLYKLEEALGAPLDEDLEHEIRRELDRRDIVDLAIEDIPRREAEEIGQHIRKKYGHECEIKE